MKILIADDSKVIRFSFKKLLSSIKGITKIIIADNVEEAINLIVKESPDILILDIRFPEGSGFDVLEAIKTVDSGSIVIVLTNYSIEKYRIKSMELGADYFFDKSGEFQKVISIIESKIMNQENEYE